MLPARLAFYYRESLAGRPCFYRAMCIGVVPQQPPRTCAPIATHSRQKIELERRALELKEKQVKRVLGGEDEQQPPGEYRQLRPDVLKRIREIYGLSEKPAEPVSKVPTPS